MRQLGYTHVEWWENNPILPDRVVGYEVDTLMSKQGDGTTPWNDLPYNLIPAQVVEDDSYQLIERGGFARPLI